MLLHYYVWSGSLRGVRVRAELPEQAVAAAVKKAAPCHLGAEIRVSSAPQGLHHADTYFEAPYEDQFPELFSDEDLEVEVVYAPEAS
jgi:hypothetical protein